jgi:ribosome-binding factor A
MKQTIKQRQIAALIQKEFSTVLQIEGDIIYGDALVTVTRVKMSADMGIAYIYLSVYNTLYKQEIIKEMWENLSRLRGELGRRIKRQVRRIPVLKFFIDDTMDEMEHVDLLFKNINNPEFQERSMKEVMEMKAAKEIAAQKAAEADDDDIDGDDEEFTLEQLLADDDFEDEEGEDDERGEAEMTDDEE